MKNKATKFHQKNYGKNILHVKSNNIVKKKKMNKFIWPPNSYNNFITEYISLQK